MSASESQGGSAGAPRGDVEVVEPSAQQAALARRVAEAKATVPHVYLQARADMTRVAALRADPAAPKPIAFVARAAALALRDCPLANATYRDGRFELHSRVNVGVGVGGPDGTVIAVIRDADAKPLETIAHELRELEDRAAGGAITRPELSGATFSIHRYDEPAGVRPLGVVPTGHAATLAVGAVVDAVVAHEGRPVVRPVLDLGLSCDARILQANGGTELLIRMSDLLASADAL